MVDIDRKEILKRAKQYLRKGQLTEAISEYEKLLDISLEPNIVNLLGDLYAKSGNNTKAIDYFSWVAEKYCQETFYIKAIAMYKKIYRLSPSNLEIELKLAELYAKKKYNVEAKEFYLKALQGVRNLDNQEKLIEILKPLLCIDPENYARKLELANAYRKTNMISQSQELYIEVGKNYLAQGKIEKAVDIFRKAFNQDPSFKPALKFFIESLLKVGSLPQAIKVIKDTIIKYPLDIDLLIMLGRTYLSVNMLDEAELTFQKLFSKDKTRYSYLLEVAKLFISGKEFNRAVNILEIIVNSSLEKRQKRNVLTLLHSILTQDKNHIKALQCLANLYQLLREKDSQITTLELLVKACFEHNLRAEAITALRNLIELVPSNIVYWQELQSLSNNLDMSQFGEFLLNPSTNITQPIIEAIVAKESFVSTNSNNTDTIVLSAENTNHLKIRINLLNSFLESKPEDLNIREQLKDLYLSSNNTHSAAQQYVEMAKIYYADHQDKNKAKELLLEACKYDPMVGNTNIFQQIVLNNNERVKSTIKKLNSNENFLEKIFEQNNHSKPTQPKTKTLNKQVMFEQKLEIPTNWFVENSKNSSQPLLPTDKSQKLTVKDLTVLLTKKNILWQEWYRTCRANEDLSIIAIKIDNYSDYFLSFGQNFITKCMTEIQSHIDNVLQRAADQLINCDNVQLVILPGTNGDGAIAVAQKIRNNVAKLKAMGNSLSVSQAIVSIKPKRNNKPNILINKLVKNFSSLVNNGDIFID
ncbi:MAG: tetratricopeptide repeat protein [Blastocatellia bacterium]